MCPVSRFRTLVDEPWRKSALPADPRALADAVPTFPYQRVALFLNSRNEVEIATRHHAG